MTIVLNCLRKYLYNRRHPIYVEYMNNNSSTRSHKVPFENNKPPTCSSCGSTDTEDVDPFENEGYSLCCNKTIN